MWQMEHLRQFPMFQEASSDILADLEKCAVSKSFQKGEHLFLDKQPVEALYLLVEGCAALYKLDCHEDRRIIFILKRGEWVNEVILDGRPASINCQFLSDSQIVLFEKHAFLTLCAKDSFLAQNIIRSLALKTRRLYHQLRNTSNMVRGDKRIAAKLWKFSRDFGKPCPNGTLIALNISITLLAEMLGSKRETVSRQLKSLTEMGLVRFECHRFIIPDRSALRDYYMNP